MCFFSLYTVHRLVRLQLVLYAILIKSHTQLVIRVSYLQTTLRMVGRRIIIFWFVLIHFVRFSSDATIPMRTVVWSVAYRNSPAQNVRVFVWATLLHTMANSFRLFRIMDIWIWPMNVWVKKSNYLRRMRLEMSTHKLVKVYVSFTLCYNTTFYFVCETWLPYCSTARFRLARWKSRRIQFDFFPNNKTRNNWTNKYAYDW